MRMGSPFSFDLTDVHPRLALLHVEVFYVRRGEPPRTNSKSIEGASKPRLPRPPPRSCVRSARCAWAWKPEPSPGQPKISRYQFWVSSPVLTSLTCTIGEVSDVWPLCFVSTRMSSQRGVPYSNLPGHELTGERVCASFLFRGLIFILAGLPSDGIQKGIGKVFLRLSCIKGHGLEVMEEGTCDDISYFFPSNSIYVFSTHPRCMRTQMSICARGISLED